MTDAYLFRYGSHQESPQPDNIRIYVPIDLNKQDILRRLETIIETYGEPTKEKLAVIESK